MLRIANSAFFSNGQKLESSSGLALQNVYIVTYFYSVMHTTMKRKKTQPHKYEIQKKKPDTKIYITHVSTYYRLVKQAKPKYKCLGMLRNVLVNVKVQLKTNDKYTVSDFNKIQGKEDHLMW